MKRFVFVAVLLSVFVSSVYAATPDADRAAVALRASLAANPMGGALVALANRYILPKASSPSTVRRRAVSPPAGSPTPVGNASCATVPLPRAGSVATYIEHVFDDPLGINPTTTLVYTYKESSASRIVYEVQSSSTSSAGDLGSTDIKATLNYVTVGSVLATKDANIDMTLSLLGASAEAVFDTHFAPAFPTQPLSQWCSDASWPIPAGIWSGTVSSSGSSDSFSLPYPAATGKVFARETIVTPAGTYDTFKMVDYMGSLISAASSGNADLSNLAKTYGWYDVKTGIPVRYDFVDAGGKLTGRAELTSLK